MTTMTSDYIDKYSNIVANVASSYSRMYKMVPVEDIRQELWIWFMTHPRKLAEWEKLDSEKETVKLVARSLRNAAHDYCTKEKAQYEGYDVADIFWYRKEFIKTILPAALSQDYKKIAQTLGEGTSTGKSPAESGDWMAYAADIRKSFDSLTKEDQELVYNFYAVDMDGNALHENFGEGKPTARATMMAANRALNKMVKNLGGFKPFNDPELPETTVEDDTDEDDM